MTANPLTVIASEPPEFPRDEVAQALRRHYGIEAGTLTALVSERDQNLRVASRDGEFVFKIANAAEDPAVTGFQIDALRHIEGAGQGAPPVPRVVLTASGHDRVVLRKDGRPHVARLVTWLPGRLLEDVPLGNGLCRELGAGLARLGRALAGFDRQPPAPSHQWDMKQSPALRRVLERLPDGGLRELVGRCIDDYEREALPAFARLRSQVIHQDFHRSNVLVSTDEPPRLAGVIDFGDMQRSPLVVDVAVAVAYLRDRERPLARILEFVAGYHAVTPLTADEIEILPVLVRMRLATTLAVLGWRRELRGAGDVYLQDAAASEADAQPFLEQLLAMPAGDVIAELQAACAAVQPVS